MIGSWTLGTWIFNGFLAAIFLEMIGIFCLWKATGREQSIRSAFGILWTGQSMLAQVANSSPIARLCAAISVLGRFALMLSLVAALLRAYSL